MDGPPTYLSKALNAAAWAADRLPLTTWWFIPSILIAGFLVWSSAWIVYNLFFHPLARFPGPLEARAMRTWYCRKLLSGKVSFEIGAMHEKYGDVIRIGPDELSFNAPEAWNDIYGYRYGKGEFMKDPTFYNVTSSGKLSIIGSDTKRHGELRRLMAHGYSDRALRDQIPVIKSYGDLFFSRLRDLSKKPEPVDMVKWMNFLTFDVIGDLAFGESFNCLETSKYHDWISIVFDNIKLSAYLRCTLYYPKWFRPIMSWFIPSHLVAHRKGHMVSVRDKAIRRLNSKSTRIDLLARLADPSSGITLEEFVSNSGTVIVAGSDTTANLLAGVVHFLSQNRRCYDRLAAEVRAAFKDESEVEISKANQLEYLGAVLQETLRRYPPTPAHLPRRTNMDDVLAGNFVPKETTVSITAVVMSHTEKYFKRPQDFVPERWLGDPEFKDDVKDALQPFSFGPRACIGRNLAYIEMRLTISRMMLNFDFECVPGYENWNMQNIYLGWQKVPLPIRLTART